MYIIYIHTHADKKSDKGNKGQKIGLHSEIEKESFYTYFAVEMIFVVFVYVSYFLFSLTVQLYHNFLKSFHLVFIKFWMLQL
jgi:hypothetical protein